MPLQPLPLLLLFALFLLLNPDEGLAAASPSSSPPRRGFGPDAWAAARDRARSLVGQMSLEEKVNITGGFPATHLCGGSSGSVQRLGWKGMCLHDGGNGVRATDLVNAYPAALHAGASWDRSLTYRRGLHMAREFRAKGVNVLLGPNAGPLGRTPLGGRNWEGFSVDPYLAGQLNAETIVATQDAGVIANVKHYIANEQETFRRPYAGTAAVSANIDDRTLHELYLWPFMDAVHAGVASLMCSYNRVNGTYACDSEHLLRDVLKTELAFPGFVVADWHAVHGIGSANAGLDMVMPDQGRWGASLVEAVKRGEVSEERLTDMATRIVTSWYLVGQADNNFPDPGHGMYNLTEPHEPVPARDPAADPAILEGAIGGHVLLKNGPTGAAPDGHHLVLPLSTRPPPRILSVFGYDAAAPVSKNTDVRFQLGYESYPEMADAVLGEEKRFDQAARGGTIIAGGRAGANAPPYISDPLSALQDRARQDGTWINWDLGSYSPPVNPSSSVCLVFINAMATEGWDRTGLHDDPSDGLVGHVADRCANTVVVIHAAGTRLVDPWISHPNVTAAVLAHLPGQDSGRALVQLLYGEANFSGKLPYTIARHADDYPVLAPCRGHGEGVGPDDNDVGQVPADPQCDFDEGLFLDYRWFDARNVTPRFEFGHGLSYTTFSYSSLGLSNSPTLGAVTTTITDPELLWSVAAVVTARVRNVGSRAGAEVAQLYLGIPGEGSPPRQLRGFDKVWLEPGEAQTVRFELTLRDLAVWDVAAQAWRLQEGRYGVYCGPSSRRTPLEAVFQVGADRKDGGGSGQAEL